MNAHIATSSFRCRSCGGDDFAPILSLGETPLANRLLSEHELTREEPRYPLDVVYCRACHLVQITQTIPPEELFREYVYFSSFSDEMLERVQWLVSGMLAVRRLGADALVLEIASNDGYLLQYYLRAGVPVLGIEPARNVAEVARRERHIPTICEFFDEALAQRLVAEGRQADVVHAHNVLAHVADLNGFVRGVSRVLKPDGVWVIEVPWVRDLIDQVEFDTIYHEHLCYFSLAALEPLLARHGLALGDAVRVPIHGGTLRCFVGHAERTAPSRRLQRLLDDEVRWGSRDEATYAGFGERVAALREQLVRTLVERKAAGRRIAAYGASAKGSTLLNYFGIRGNLLDFVVDRSPVKQGRYTPGTHLPISPPERLIAEMPDDVLLLTWNFLDEILLQQSEYRRRGGRFIVPVPEVRIV
jgi:SAM-dependent methyltransferase